MAKSKEEALAALQRATKYGNFDSSKLSKLSKSEIDEFQQELSTYMSGGVDDVSRDEAQVERIQRLAADAAEAI